jgi:hypothetical protein
MAAFPQLANLDFLIVRSLEKMFRAPPHFSLVQLRNVELSIVIELLKFPKIAPWYSEVRLAKVVFLTIRVLLNKSIALAFLAVISDNSE